MIKRLFAVALICAPVLGAAPALASACAARDDLIAQLQQKYSEHLTAGGLHEARAGAAIMEIWASADTGTFTILLSHANGVSCIVAAGTDFFQAKPAPKPEGVAG